MRIFVFLVITGLLYSCSPRHQELLTANMPYLVSAQENNASGPYFTLNPKGVAVLVWTEKLPGGDETGHIIKFAGWDNKTARFGPTKEVNTSKGCRSHDESMNKIAFKKDGTIVAVFSKRTPSAENRFAGALYYTQSFDEGQNWADAQYLHIGDTIHGRSRSFFDLATLSDGEVGAIWLDSRLTKKRGDGSSLLFAKTKGAEGFIEDKVIATSTCECCRTDLFVAANGNIHVIYRDIWQDTIRDMSHLVSKDNGRTFSDAKRISPDNWVINGCPHTGPSMAETNNELHCTWFTMGGGAGIYHTSSSNMGEDFDERQLITERGRHPQMVTTSDGKLVFLWEERSNVTLNVHAGHNAEQKSVQSEKTETLTSYIKAQLWQDGQPIREHWVSFSPFYAEYPVAIDLGNGLIGVAWVQNTGEASYGIYFRRTKI